MDRLAVAAARGAVVRAGGVLCAKEGTTLVYAAALARGGLCRCLDHRHRSASQPGQGQLVSYALLDRGGLQRLQTRRLGLASQQAERGQARGATLAGDGPRHAGRCQSGGQRRASSAEPPAPGSGGEPCGPSASRQRQGASTGARTQLALPRPPGGFGGLHQRRASARSLLSGSLLAPDGCVRPTPQCGSAAQTPARPASRTAPPPTAQSQKTSGQKKPRRLKKPPRVSPQGVALLYTARQFVSSVVEWTYIVGPPLAGGLPGAASVACPARRRWPARRIGGLPAASVACPPHRSPARRHPLRVACP